MRKRPLGKTGLEVSELSLGTWGLSGDAYGPIAEGEIERIVPRAIELGIDVFETADIYGKGGDGARARPPAPRGKLIVTKIGTDLASVPPRKRFQKSAFSASRSSSRRIGSGARRSTSCSCTTRRCWRWRRRSPSIFLKELKKRGTLKAWGVSAGSVEVARSAIRHGAEVIELAYNLFVAADLHEIAGDVADSGCAVLARSVLSHGLLTGHWTAEREFNRPDHRAERWTASELKQRISQLEALRPVVTGPVLTLRSAALRFVMSNQLVTSAVLGPRSVAQLEQLVREAGFGPPYLRDTALAELAARLKGVGILV